MNLEALSEEVNKYVPVWRLRQAAEAATNYVMNYTEAEVKVREATNEDPWGPEGPILNEIAKMTSMYSYFGEIMGMLWSRMCQDNEGAWRRVYKGLLVLDFLIKNGSDRCVVNAKEHVYDLRTLQHYHHTDNKGKDQGINIRHRAKEICELLASDDAIRQARETARKNREKFGGRGSSYGGSYGSSSENYGGMGGGSRGGTGFGTQAPAYNSNYDSNRGSSGLSGDYGTVEPEEPSPTFEANFEEPKKETTSAEFDTEWAAAPSVPRETLNSVPSPKTKKKSVPRKMVSLGAAAAYAGNQPSTNRPAAKTEPSSNFDLLGGLDTPAEIKPASVQNNSQNWDPFSGAAPAQETKKDTQNWDPFSGSQEQPQPKKDDPFGNWLDSTPSTNTNTTSTNDILNSLTPTSQPATQTTNSSNNTNASSNLNDLFGSMSMVNSASNSTNLTQQSTLTPMSNSLNAFPSQPVIQNSQTQNNVRKASQDLNLKPSSTWAGIGNLDDLISIKPETKGPSMNSLMK